MFFKYEATITNENWNEENENRSTLRDKINKINNKSSRYNDSLQRGSYIFVQDASYSTVTIGIFCDSEKSAHKYVTDYLRNLDIHVRDGSLSEISFSSIKKMIRNSNNSGYIEDEDAVLEDLDLDVLTDNHWHYLHSVDEQIIVPSSIRQLYSEANKLPTRETLTPELDRICKKNTSTKILGHPVHYIIETDERDVRNAITSILIKALLQNNRIQSKRYVSIDIKARQDISIEFINCLYKSSYGGAIIINLRSNNYDESDLATENVENIENICRIVNKYRSSVLTIFSLARECTRYKQTIFANSETISFVEIKEELLSGESAIDHLRMLARMHKIRVDKALLGKLEDGHGYLSSELRMLFENWYDNKLKTSIYPQYKDIQSSVNNVKKETHKGSAYDELMNMIGLAEAKKIINQALDYQKAQKIFASRGMISDYPSRHMVFTGNPGTAKTSVARLYARIMKDNGLLSKGTLLEVGRGDLVGKFVGWTAPTIQRKFKEANGGILFIDEAYSLVDDRSGSYGDEAINTIVQEMENHRDDVIVIFAGYPDKMEQFLQKNPGLRSRIAYHVPFDDYSTEDLCEIATLLANKKGLTLAPDCEAKLTAIFDSARTTGDFGNGRYVRNVIEKAKMAQASRLLTMDYDSLSNSDITTIHAEDIEMPAIELPSLKRKSSFGFIV